MNREKIQLIQSKDKSTHRPYATTVNIHLIKLLTITRCNRTT